MCDTITMVTAKIRSCETASYREQVARWPREGRHIMAHYDDDSIIVYQAYRPSIGDYAAEHQRFGGDWSFSRMSWIKPNFLWMMYRCGWGEKSGQEVVLAIRLDRRGFDEFLADSVHSSYDADAYGSQAAWRGRVAASSVRLQWDPDHDPKGEKVARRAVQLGLRGASLRDYATRWCRGVEDISGFVREQGQLVRAGALDKLETPSERVYPVDDPAVAGHLGITPWKGCLRAAGAPRP